MDESQEVMSDTEFDKIERELYGNRDPSKLDDMSFPVAVVPRLSQVVKPAENQNVIKKIIQGAVKAAYQKKTPTAPAAYSWGQINKEYGKPIQQAVSNEELEMVVHLIESLEPQNAIEAALAAQFVVAHIRGMDISIEDDVPIDLFGFSHEVLETLQKYRTKGAQLINVQYNVNKGQVVSQVVNISNEAKQENPIEVKAI